jgi:tetratricopeptide (TPR) repeat protein
LQSEVARAIAGEIRLTLTPQEEARLASARQVDPEAHMAYLKGRFFWNKQTREEIEKACEHFRRAIDIDPAYAPAYAGLSDAYFDLALWALPPGEADARRDARARSKAAANRAVEIDPKLSEAYASLASTRIYLDWDWPGAEITFRKAVELNPSNSLARHYYSDFLSAMGRHEEAIEEAQRAEALDPLSAFRSSAVAQVLFRARQYDRAIRQLRKALDLDPDFQLAHVILGHCYFEKGQRKEAVAAWGNMHALSGNRELAQAYAELDFEVAARKWLEQAAGPSSPIYNNPGLVAKVYGQLGDNDRAFEWFERAYAARDRQLIYLGVDPFMDPLRSDPRFQDLLRRMNFPV